VKPYSVVEDLVEPAVRVRMPRAPRVVAPGGTIHVIRDVPSFVAFCSGPSTMPRGPRRDAPDTLHHGRVRGIEGRAIVRDAPDRADVLRRLGEVAGATDLALSAWALVPNHRHRLVRTRCRGPCAPS
jgi:hypothetical protein